MAFEKVKVRTRKVSCDGAKAGTNKAAGHPKVYLHITHDQITCPYCSKVFVLECEVHDAH